MTDDTTAPPVLPPLTVGEWGEAEYAAFGALLGVPGEKVPRAGSGHRLDPLHFDIIGVLARHPEMARTFLSFNGWLLQRGELSLRLRELAILRVAISRRSAFFWAEHHRIALAGGVSTDDIDRLARGNDGFAGQDLMVLEAADELIADGQLSPGTWQRLAVDLGTHQAMELLFVIGTYTMLAAAFATWQLLPPADVPLPATVTRSVP